jgi:enoyl-CoA hydratase/carnithine racemase
VYASEHFDYEEWDGTARVTFNRPDSLNSLTFGVYDGLRSLTAELADRGDISALVIRGTGKGFCSGGDVNDIIGNLIDRPTREVYDFAHMTGAVIRNLRDMPQPVIASVNGAAAGAGAVIAAACDFRILARSASFQFLFTKVGLSGGDMGITWLLPRIIGFGHATKLLMLGNRVDSSASEALGLATEVVDDADLDATVDGYVERLRGFSPWGLRMTKEMLNRSASVDYSTAVEMEAWTQSLLMTAEDFREFRESFAEKRKPIYKGR